MSDSLISWLKHCKTRPDIDQSSNHIPVSTSLSLLSELLLEINR